MSRLSHKKLILRHLRTHGNITPMMALNRFGCNRLAARIYDLRKDGHNIKTVMRYAGREQYANYVLDEEPD